MFDCTVTVELMTLVAATTIPTGMLIYSFLDYTQVETTLQKE